MVDELTKDDEGGMGAPERVAIAAEFAENGAMLALPTLEKSAPALYKAFPAISSGAQAVVGAATSYAEYDKGMREYKSVRGDPEDYAVGYNLGGEYDPWQESEEKQAKNAWISFGKTLAIVAVGIPLLCLGITNLWLLIPASIVLAIATGWGYDKLVGRSDAQDPIKLVGATKQLHEEGKEVPKELIFSLMLTSLEPGNEMRKAVEARLKSATGDHKLHHIIINPDAMPAVDLIMKDPAVINYMCDHYGVMRDPQLFERVTSLYNQGLLDQRAIEFAHSGDLALMCNQEQMLQQKLAGCQPVVAPSMPMQPFAKPQTVGFQPGTRH